MKKAITLLLILFSSVGMTQVLPTPTGTFETDAPLTLGMRFKAKVNGTVTGARVYGFGTTAQMWSISGTLLAQSTLTGTGWKTASFASPVQVVAGADYIISYFTSSQYYSDASYFPKTFTHFDGVNSLYKYSATEAFPTSTYLNSNYFVEPIISETKTDTVYITNLVRDTIRTCIDTCSIDYTKLTDLQFVLVLPEETGGTVRLPDSTTVYQAICGAMQPHERAKDDIANIMYRFQRNYTIKGTSTPVRFTLYKTGAWIRELKDTAGVWKIYPYAPY